MRAKGKMVVVEFVEGFCSEPVCVEPVEPMVVLSRHARVVTRGRQSFSKPNCSRLNPNEDEDTCAERKSRRSMSMGNSGQEI